MDKILDSQRITKLSYSNIKHCETLECNFQARSCLHNQTLCSKAVCDFTVKVNLLPVEEILTGQDSFMPSSVHSSCAYMKRNQCWRKEAKFYIYLIKIPMFRSCLFTWTAIFFVQ